MVYTKRGPFVDSSTTGPYLNSAFFNGIEAVLSTAGANALTGWFHVDQYGAAVGASPTANRTAIQNAINDANTSGAATSTLRRVYFPEIYPVSVTTYYGTGTTPYGFTSLLMRDWVWLTGPGGISAPANAYTAADTTGAGYGALIRSTGGLSHARITEITVDGNTANQSVANTGSNIEIAALDDVEISNTKQLRANRNGMRITSPTPSPVQTNTRMNNNTVDTCGGIGIQCSNFDGLQIIGNRVANTGDNCIDIYGNDGSTTSSGRNFVIADNVCRNGATGVFLETVADGSAHHNVIINCTSTGVWVNRIVGYPQNITVDHNTIVGGVTGIGVYGDTGGVHILGNTVRGATGQCVRLGSGSGSVSYVYLRFNTLNGSTASVPLVNFTGAQAAHIRIRGTVSYTSTTLPTVTSGTQSDVLTDAVNI